MRTAVLCSEGVHYYDGKLDREYRYIPLFEEGPMCLIDLLQGIEAMRLDSLWILSGVPVSTVAKDADKFQDAPGYEVRVVTRNNGAVTGLKCWKKEGTREERRLVRIVFVEHARYWGWYKITDGAELLKTITDLQLALTIPLEMSPGATGRALMLLSLEGYPRWLEKSDLLSAGLTSVPLASPLRMKRPLTEEEKQKKYYVVYDKNAMYLAACTGVELGVGTPQYVKQAGKNFKEKLPGLWHVEVYLNTPFFEENHLEYEGWAWTPQVHYWKRKGYDITFKEAYIWPEHHSVLRAWAERLWKARTSLLDNPQAIKAIKLIYAHALGWLNLTEERDREQKSWMFRPDWDALIKEHAYMLIRFKIDNLKKQGYDPCFVSVDEIGYITDDPNGIPLLNGDITDLGGFKLKAKIELTPELCQVFDDSVPFVKAQKALLEEARKEKEHVS